MDFMNLIIKIPADKYNEIVFNDIDALREVVKNGVVVTDTMMDDYQRWYEKGVNDTWENVTTILNNSRDEFLNNIEFVKKDEPNRIAKRAINLHPNDIFYFNQTADAKAKRITSIRYGFDTRFPLTITYIHLDTFGEGYITADTDDCFYVVKEG